MTVMKKKKAYVCSDRLSRKQRSNRGLRQNPENSASLLLKSKPPSGKKYEKERNDAVCIKRPFGPKDFPNPFILSLISSQQTLHLSTTAPKRTI